MHLPLAIFLALLSFFSVSILGCGRVPSLVLPLSASSDANDVSARYPWVALLYKTTTDDVKPMRICGGTLISHNIVMTAAFCVADDNTSNKNNLTVVLGKVHSDWDIVDLHQQTHQVEKILIHENYSGRSTNYAHAISLIVLKDNVTFNSHVQPACLDLETSTANIQNGTILHAAGWEINDPIRNEIREASLAYLDTKTCLEIAGPFKDFLQSDKFCSLPSNETEPSRGDSGQGLVIERDRQHYVIGMITVKSIDRNIFANTRISNYKSWLENNMAKAQR